MNKRLLALLSVLVLASMVLVACGQPAATPTEAAPEVTEAPEATEAPAGGCTDAIGCVDIAPGDPIHFAYALSVSGATARSEEHTSELQSRRDLVCRLLLEKKKK